MSKQAQLPPRCPLQKKTMGRQATVPVSSPSCKDTELHARQWGHCETFSQSFILEEQPAWLNDLLSDTDSNWNGALHRRAASDSFTIFDGLVPLPDLDQLNETETADSCEPDDGLGSGCTYGPNSPRRKNKWSLPEKEIVFSIFRNMLCKSLRSIEVNMPPGQRSRARKLQYIADLERSVDILQNLGSELAVTVASIIQQNAALSMENNTLKQQLLRMQRQKFIVDNEFQSLKKEVGRLKTSLTVSANNVYNRSSFAANLAHSDAMWEMVNLADLASDIAVLVSPAYAIGSVEVNDDPEMIDLSSCDFHIHIHSLPMEKMNQEVASFIVRIRVSIDVSKPLKRALKLHIVLGDENLVTFTYERLQNFCYLCGCLGHLSHQCEIQLQEGFSDLGDKTPYGNWLRATAPLSSRGRISENGVRDSGGIPRHPTFTSRSSLQSQPELPPPRRGSAIFGNFGNPLSKTILPTNQSLEPDPSSPENPPVSLYTGLVTGLNLASHPLLIPTSMFHTLPLIQ
ncbi:UNVERIFIED_CONTAM: hypothetical protein Sangu_2134300 [Sesamum angustifolium]|uniref:CCHC-type domain-containing protein n=1 Tax=Sesamum angustifolium TaxID=2727405 RepID=A0AAW2LFM4_9LAMI